MRLLELLMMVSTVKCWEVLEPNSDSVWESDTQVQIQWNSTAVENAQTPRIDVDLMVGPGNGVVVMAIGNEVPSNVTSAVWTVSKFLSTRSDYFIRLTQAGQNSSTLAYSERFNVLSPLMMGAPPSHKDASASSSILFGVDKAGSRVAALVVTVLLLCFFSH